MHKNKIWFTKYLNNIDCIDRHIILQKTAVNGVGNIRFMRNTGIENDSVYNKIM